MKMVRRIDGISLLEKKETQDIRCGKFVWNTMAMQKEGSRGKGEAEPMSQRTHATTYIIPKEIHFERGRRTSLIPRSGPEDGTGFDTEAAQYSASGGGKGRAVNHRLFASFCEEIGAEHSVLLYHTEVRWLSRGRVLTRVFELHEEIMQFLRNQGSEIADHFENREFILSLAYLADVFMHLNELNVSMQGTAMNMITAREKLSALTRKLPMWIKCIESGNFANFPSLDEAASAEEELPILSEVKEHLQELIQSFQGYFHLEEGSVAQRWIRDPFLFNLDSMDDNDIMKDDLVELQTNDRIRMEFEKMQLDMFWCAQLQAFPQLARRALEVLVPFATTYLCEAGFSTLLHVKTKARNRLDASDDMRRALSKKEPRLNNIINEKQQQKSH
ncbi:protein FAM200C-like [Palaemon carinicauda]|uniref:protein FAM200C-like n=1 Tax=Palaemon carinicauda TaxID=392227 RepID=UPI0035B6368E